MFTLVSLGWKLDVFSWQERDGSNVESDRPWLNFGHPLSAPLLAAPIPSTYALV